MASKNIITLTDSYKIGHWNMLPNDTEYVYSYFESRNGAKFNNTVFFGLQYLLKEYLCGMVVTREKIESAAKLCKAHFGTEKYFNRTMWEYILEKYEGNLPIKICAVPEGTPIPVSNVLMTVVNTDPKCAALTNYLETLLTHVWSTSTVATLSGEVYKLLKFYRDATGNDDYIQYGLHDFGFRGVSSVESAGIEGAGHLIHFLGTDTLRAMEVAIEYYSASLDNLAFSVAATEHSVMTARGKEGEEQVFAELLEKYPEGILSVVIDSYNYKNFINVITKKYKNQILSRNGKVVFRPDSGEPNSVTLDVFNMLDNIFGYTINSKGYKELNTKVGVLWGDGIDYDGIRSILFTLRNNNYSTNCIVFGMGGGLLQKINRDINRFAFKSSAQCRNGIWYDIFKNPLDASKASKKGRLSLIKDEKGLYKTISWKNNTSDINDLLIPVFENGKLLVDYTFNQVRENCKL